MSDKLKRSTTSIRTNSSLSINPVTGSSTDLARDNQIKTSISWTDHTTDFSEEFSQTSESSEYVAIPKLNYQGTPSRTLSFKLDEDDQRTQIRLKRAAYTYDELEQTYLQISDDGTKQPCCQKPTCEDVLPAVYYARVYKCKQYFLFDVVAGFIVAGVHLTQGLAYGLLANLTPISGVYTSIFSSLLYVIFGTVPHISMGTQAILSLMTGAMVEREADRILSESDRLPEYQLGDTEKRMNIKMGVAMVSTFQCGLILLLLGLFRLGFLTNYMPSSFVEAFLSAGGLHIAVSQIKHVFHIKVPLRAGFGMLVLTLVDIGEELKNSKTADAMTFAVSISLLLLMNLVINPAIKAKVKVVLPSNLILAFIGCVVSYSLDLHAKFGIAVVGPISSEPLATKLPPLTDLKLSKSILYDSLLQAVIVFTMSISMAMLMEKLHDYELDINKELIAYGMCNLCSSFFEVQSSCTSPNRTKVLSSCGAKTTFNGISTVLVLLCTVTVLEDTFQSIPLATLAAMVIVGTMGQLIKILTVPNIWRVSRTDFFVWVCTYLSTTVGDLGWGICIGILMAAMGFIVNNQRIKGQLVVQSTKEDLLMPGLSRALTKHVDSTRIFYFPSQLFFANAESFKRQLYEQVFDPSIRWMSRATQDSTFRDLKNVHFIILDCSAMTYIDIDGLNMLKTVVIRYHNAGVQMMLARCPHTAMRTLERGDFFKILPRSMVFHEVIDALARGTSIQVGSNESMTFIAPIIRRVSTASFSAKSSTSI